MMVLRRWAMVRTVHSLNLSRIVFWISSSVLQGHRNNKNKQIRIPSERSVYACVSGSCVSSTWGPRWLWPRRWWGCGSSSGRLWPDTPAASGPRWSWSPTQPEPSPTYRAAPPRQTSAGPAGNMEEGSGGTCRVCVGYVSADRLLASSSAFHRSSSLCWPKGSRFFLTVSVNSTGSWGPWRQFNTVQRQAGLESFAEVVSCLPVGWWTSSGAGHGGRSQRSEHRRCRSSPEALPGGTALRPESFSQHRSDPQYQPYAGETHRLIMVHCASWQAGCGFVQTNTSHLLMGLEGGVDVSEHQRAAVTVGEVHVVKGHQTFVWPIRRGALLCLPGCFAFQLCILHHPLHWRHLKRGEVLSHFCDLSQACVQASLSSHHVLHFGTLPHRPLEVSHQCHGVGEHQAHLSSLQPCQTQGFKKIIMITSFKGILFSLHWGTLQQVRTCISQLLRTAQLSRGVVSYVVTFLRNVLGERCISPLLQAWQLSLSHCIRAEETTELFSCSASHESLIFLFIYYNHLQNNLERTFIASVPPNNQPGVTSNMFALNFAMNLLLLKHLSSQMHSCCWTIQSSG